MSEFGVGVYGGATVFLFTSADVKAVNWRDLAGVGCDAARQVAFDFIRELIDELPYIAFALTEQRFDIAVDDISGAHALSFCSSAGHCSLRYRAS